MKTQIAEIQKEWCGYLSGKTDADEATVSVKSLYTALGYTEPTIYACSSVEDATKVRKKSSPESLGYATGTEVRRKLREMVWESVAELYSKIEANRRDPLNVLAIKIDVPEVFGKGEGLQGNLLYNTTKLEICAQIDFAIKQGLIEESSSFKLLKRVIANLHACYAYEKVVYIIQKPVAITYKESRLHSDDGPAVRYADRTGHYYLNGIKAPSEYVETRAEEIPTEWVIKENNVELRKELLRKIGMERMLEHGEKLDQWNTYELWNMEAILPRVTYAPYLLMRNPSMPGVIHLEGVHEDCRTCKEAINWRAGNIQITWKPSQLS